MLRKKKHKKIIGLRIQTEAKNIIDFVKSFPDEKACIKYLEEVHWKDGQICPHCKCNKFYPYKDGINYKCAGCRQRYNIKVGSLFENSKISLHKWFIAIYISSSHKKGISSCQLARDLDITQKTAWFMLHRIRTMMKDIPIEKLKGIVESDGTLVGGNLRFKKKHEIEAIKKKYNTEKPGGNVAKTPVLGIIERGGNVIMAVTGETDGKTLKPILTQYIDQSAKVFTDTFGAYSGIEKYFAEHSKTNHSNKEYVRGEVHSNNIEAVWNHFKRMIVGTYHYVSPKHLQNYCFEMMLRYNTRNYKSEFDRFEYVVFRSAGRRLKFEELISDLKEAA